MKNIKRSLAKVAVAALIGAATAKGLKSHFTNYDQRVFSPKPIPAVELSCINNASKVLGVVAGGNALLLAVYGRRMARGVSSVFQS